MLSEPLSQLRWWRGWRAQGQFPNYLDENLKIFESCSFLHVGRCGDKLLHHNCLPPFLSLCGVLDYESIPEELAVTKSTFIDEISNIIKNLNLARSKLHQQRHAKSKLIGSPFTSWFVILARLHNQMNSGSMLKISVTDCLPHTPWTVCIYFYKASFELFKGNLVNMYCDYQILTFMILTFKWIPLSNSEVSSAMAFQDLSKESEL